MKKVLNIAVMGCASIAERSMMPAFLEVPDWNLVAVASRGRKKAEVFANQFNCEAVVGYEKLLNRDDIDAIYMPLPTGLHHEWIIKCLDAGKHVLAEKPFASLQSMQNIIAACRENNVGFMDGTHFVHHPRTHQIRKQKADAIGWAWSVASAFQFNLTDKGNIRYNPELEPMGAVGDAGWYNMRAAVEYLAPDAELESADAHLRRDTETGAAVSGSGVLRFTDGSTSTWNCGFDSGAVVMDLRVSGTRGSVNLDDFLSQSPDGSADYRHRVGGWGPGSKSSTINVDSPLPGSALMFKDFATIVAEPSLREQWASASIRTQTLLDAVWQSAINNE